MQPAGPLLRLKPHLQAIPVRGKGAFVFDGDEYFFLEGSLLADLMQDIVDGEVHPGKTTRRLDGRYPEAELRAYVGQLHADGLVYETLDSEHDEVDVFWSRLGFDPYQVRTALAARPVAVRSWGRDERRLRGAFDEVGIRIASDGVAMVVLVDDLLYPGLAKLNRRVREDGQTLMVIRAGGRASFVALFAPEAGPCWECMAERLRQRQPVREFVEGTLGRSVPGSNGRFAFASAEGWVYHRAAVELARWLVGGTGEAPHGSLLEIDAGTGIIRAHPFRPIATCPVCGTSINPSLRPEPIQLESRVKNRSVANGTRSISAKQAYSRVRHLLDPVFGPFRDLVRLDHSTGAHSYVIRHSMASRIDTIEKLKNAEQHLSGGKGRARYQAMASAVYEGVERRSGRWRPDRYAIVATAEELGEDAVDLQSLLGFSPKQYLDRGDWNARTPNPVLRVPEPLNPAERVAWVPAWSVTNRRFRYVPATYAFYDYPHTGAVICTANSNGCAAGSNLEEALLQGAFELIERDALSMWWLVMARRPSVSLESFGDRYFRRVLLRHERVGRRAWVLDLTHDLGVPVLLAVSRAAEGIPNWVIGAGAHFNARVAASRALSEMDQLVPALTDPERATRIAGTGEGRGRRAWFQAASEDELPYLLPDPTHKNRSSGDFQNPETGDLLADIGVLVERFREGGMEMLVIDQTDPVLGVPVVRVIVPGLMMHWRRLGAERLYRVPVEIGWTKHPPVEEGLNPLPLPL